MVLDSPISQFGKRIYFTIWVANMEKIPGWVCNFCACLAALLGSIHVLLGNKRHDYVFQQIKQLSR